MKLLHTSDWHLGRSLYNRKRYDECEAFLNWLTQFITREQIDLLLVAGDIFDTTTPGNRAQELYYRFLGSVSGTGCRHVVITGGNHDSPTFLDAPGKLLRALNVHVVGSIPDNPEDEIITLKDRNGNPEVIVCAVPFLRDRDIRTVGEGENPEDKTQKLLKGIIEHYNKIAAGARRKNDLRNPVPVIGMGHLFTSKAKTTEGDGVRELYIGSLVHVNEKSISEGFDYMALGHLHMAQRAGNYENIRYSGSPIPMGFAEAGQKKKVIVADFNKQIPVITEHEIPCFQDLITVRGEIDRIASKLEELKAAGSNAWVEVEITSSVQGSGVTTFFEDLITGSRLEILRIKNKNMSDRAISHESEIETLAGLDDADVFQRCLDAYEITEPETRRILTETYLEARASMFNEDPNDF
jgi:exonuclease SbcD